MRSSLLRILPRGRRRLATVLAGATVLALATGGAVLGATAASADTTAAAPSTDTYVVALWQSNDPANLFPQHLLQHTTVTLDITDSAAVAKALATYDSAATGCAARYQVDLYANDATTASLIAGQKLESSGNPAESWPGGSYQGAYSKVVDRSSVACAPTGPKLNAVASGCPAAGGPASLTGTVTGVAGETYRVDLTQSGSSTVLATQNVSGSGTFTFGNRGGGTYTVTVTDTKYSNLTATQQVVVPSCGSVKDFSVEVTPCTTVGGNAAIVITSDDFGTDTYQLKDSTGTIGSAFKATGTKQTIPLTSSTSVQELTGLQLVDLTTGQSTGLGDLTVEPCPSLPTPKIAISVAACTTAGQATTDVTVTFSDLVTGRTYVPTVDGAPQTSFVQGQGTTHPYTVEDVTPGTHTYGIYDAVVRTVAASAQQNVVACPSVPRVSVVATACTTPTANGSGTTGIAVTASNLTIGHSYTVALSTGSPLVTLTTVNLQNVGSTTEQASFPSAPVGATYVVTVVDTAFAAATGSSQPVVVNKCPQVAALTFDCTASTLTIGTTDLQTGHLYTVKFERQNSDGVTYTTVTTRSVTSSSAGAMYSPVADGQIYRVTLIDNGTNGTGSTVLGTPSIVPIPDGCATPTTPTGKVDAFSITAQLAHTGVDAMPFLGLAGGFVVAGASLVGFAAYRRHKEVRD